MNTANTAAAAGVAPPKISRNSRSHAIWYTNEHAPDTSRNKATNGNRQSGGVHTAVEGVIGGALIRVGSSA
jgi:hypothetical protein